MGALRVDGQDGVVVPGRSVPWHGVPPPVDGDAPAQLDGPAVNGSTPALSPLERRVEDERVRRQARRIVDVEERPPAVIPDVSTLARQLAEPPPPTVWRIDQWQPAASRVVLAAQYKAGKTTLTGNLVRSLVDGDPFLGRYTVAPVAGRVAVLDFEMSHAQGLAWLRDQGIRNADRVLPLWLRGNAAAFDILSADGRARWAQLFLDHHVDYVVWDCLRPVVDALGLDEHREVGPLLVAFDTVLADGRVPDAAVVHHMGHNGERSRGDSRIRDWPDTEWKLVREGDDPADPRFVSAYGRDVDIRESRVDHDPATRRLTLVGGDRRAAAATAAMDDLFAYLDENPGSSGRAIEDGLTDSGHAREAIRAALDAAKSEGYVRWDPGPRRAKLHSLTASAPVRGSAPPVRQRTASECASAPIEGALHSHTPAQSSAPAGDTP